MEQIWSRYLRISGGTKCAWYDEAPFRTFSPGEELGKCRFDRSKVVDSVLLIATQCAIDSNEVVFGHTLFVR